MRFSIILFIFLLSSCTCPKIIIEKTQAEFKCEAYHKQTIYTIWTDGCFDSLAMLVAKKGYYINIIALKQICYEFFLQMADKETNYNQDI